MPWVSVAPPGTSTAAPCPTTWAEPSGPVTITQRPELSVVGCGVELLLMDADVGARPGIRHLEAVVRRSKADAQRGFHPNSEIG